MLGQRQGALGGSEEVAVLISVFVYSGGLLVYVRVWYHVILSKRSGTRLPGLQSVP